MSSKKGKIITIFSTKGGVGKTFLAINLAGVFHNLNKKVLLIDLDLYSGGIAVSLNVDPAKNIFTLVDDLNNNRFSQFNDYIVKYNDNIDVLACPIDPRQGGKIDHKYIDIILANAISRYDVILVDTSHILNDINLVALDKSDEILMVLSNDPIDLKNMKSIISIFKDSEMDNYHIVLNETININKDYFTPFDIKNIIKTNIDYTISKHFHLNDVDDFLIKGEIPILNKRVATRKKSDIAKLNKIAAHLLGGNGGEDHE